MPNSPPRKGEYVGSERRGYDPALRKYRLGVYAVFGLGLLWFCTGMIASVVNYLFFK